MKRIWEIDPKNSSTKDRLHELCFDTNLKYDDQLVPFDLMGLTAHSKMLCQCGYLSDSESTEIVEALQSMSEDSSKGKFAMTPEWEDCHSLIEVELIARVGDVGKKLYMVRSRNDQIVSAIRLYSLACQLSRGQVECQTLQAYWGVMFVINRLSNDLVLFTSKEFDFFKVGDSCTTGSSIMPNKKNLDPCEILRARYHTFSGYIEQIKGIVSNLISGYNSDFQETKPLYMEGLDLVEASIEILTLVLTNLEVNEEGTRKALTPEIYATDRANEGVMAGMSFRESYIKTKKSLASVEERDPVDNILGKTHLGAPGNPGLDIFEKRVGDFSQNQ